MKIPSLETVQRQSEGYAAFPVSCEIFADIKTPIQVLKILKSISARCYLLESVEGVEKWGRYSFLGFDPVVEVKCKDGLMEIKNGTSIRVETDDPGQEIRRILSEYRSPKVAGLPPFTGGFVGYFSYDYLKYSEPALRFDGDDSAGFNDLDLMLFEKVIAFDQLRQKIMIMVTIKTDHLAVNYNHAVRELSYLVSLIRSDVPESREKPRLLSDFKPHFDREAYCEIVEKTKSYIREGDIFQAVPSNRLTAEMEGSLFNTYRVLRTINPSPYMYYIACDDLEIAGASPETLVKLQDGELSTFPIAGTSPRGVTSGEDAELEERLLKDPKELAEHNMLVDLGRNDLGRVSRYGSVKVQEYLKIQKYSHVMHITSVVTGQLRENMDQLDAVAAVLPAGTLSGAPKIRACEIINGLEGIRRGIYGGAIGYIDFTGNMDVCIAIRTAVKKNGLVYVQSGGGVVADSDPEKEYQESINKAMAVVEAVKQSVEVMD